MMHWTSLHSAPEPHLPGHETCVDLGLFLCEAQSQVVVGSFKKNDFFVANILHNYKQHEEMEVG